MAEQRDPGDIASLFGLDPLLETPAEYRRSDEATLRLYRRVATELRAELLDVAADLRRENDHAVRYTYCVDFNAIYSALNWFSARSREAAWSRLAFDLLASRMVLLPGALFELMRYLRRRERQTEEAIGTQVVSAFQKAFEEFDADTLGEFGKLYTRLQRRIEKAPLDVEAKYLNLLLGERFSPLDSSIDLKPNDDVFYRAAYLLSHGHRLATWLNNRADALDFSIAYELTAQRRRAGEVFMILSAAPSYRRLAHLVPVSEEQVALTQTSIVRSPKVVAMHQLFRQAGMKAGEAEDLTWRAIDRLATYAAEIDFHLEARASSKRRRVSRAQWDTPEDTLIHLLASMERIQAELRKAESRRERRLGDVQLDAGDEDILRKVRLRVWQLLQESETRALLSKYVEPRPAQLTWQEHRPEGRRELPKRYTVMADGSALAYCYEYEGFVGFYCLSEASLEQFLAVFNHVRDRCSAGRIVGSWRRPPKTQTGIRIIYSDQEGSLRWDDVSVPVSALTLAKDVGCSPDDISFLRLDTPWFDASFESGMCAIATHLPLFEEVAEFLAAVARTPVESGKLGPLLSEIFRDRLDLVSAGTSV